MTELATESCAVGNIGRVMLRCVVYWYKTNGEVGVCVMDLEDGVIVGHVDRGRGRDVVVLIDSVSCGNSKL